MVSDVLLAYSTYAKNVANIPSEIRAQQVIGESERWSTGDAAIRWMMIRAWIAHPLTVDDPSSGPPFAMNPRLHTKGFGNPGTAEIERLFKTIAISNLWSRFSEKEPDRLYKSAIDEIVNRRNSIAHGDWLATVTRGDVESNLSRVRHVANIIDKIAESEICTNLGIDNVWSDSA